MSEKNSLLRNTVTLYLRMAISMFVGFFTSRILLDQLGVVDFGVYNVVGGIIIVLGFLNSTLSLSTQRFINFELGNGNFFKLQKVYSTSIVIHCSLAIVVLLLAETIGLWFLNSQMNIPESRMLAANYVYQFSILSAFLTITMIPFTATIIAHEHMGQYATIGIIDIILRFSVACILYLIQSDKLVIYAAAMSLVIIINYITYYIYCKKKFKECAFVFSRDKNLYKEMLSFSGWNVFSSISIVLNGQIVSIILNVFFGPIVNAARGISTQVNGSISGFVQNFQIAVNPRIIQTYAASQMQQFFRLISQSAKFSFYLLLILVVPIWANIDIILELWLESVPEYTIDFCRIVLISSLVNTFSLPLATAANATGNIKLFQFTCGIFELLNIPLSYILLKLGYPALAVYYVSLSIIVLTLFVRISVLKRLINFTVRKFLIQIVLRSLTIAGISFVAFMFLNTIFDKENLLGLLASLLSGFSLTVIFIVLLGLSKEEISIVKYKIINNLALK